MDFLVSLPF